jgi:hypothetical protein
MAIFALPPGVILSLQGTGSLAPGHLSITGNEGHYKPNHLPLLGDLGTEQWRVKKAFRQNWQDGRFGRDASG